MKHANREEWLHGLSDLLEQSFQEHELYYPKVLRLSCGWPSKSIRKVMGQCWTATSAKDGSRQIFVSPTIDDGLHVAGIIVHELIHACLPDGSGHKAPFVRAMHKLGLEGKATATHAGEELKQRLNKLCKELGKYPHSGLKLVDLEKKQTTRMLKVGCPNCGYVVRTTAKWLEQGTPTCPCGEEMGVAK